MCVCLLPQYSCFCGSFDEIRRHWTPDMACMKAISFLQRILFLASHCAVTQSEFRLTCIHLCMHVFRHCWDLHAAPSHGANQAQGSQGLCARCCWRGVCLCVYQRVIKLWMQCFETRSDKEWKNIKGNRACSFVWLSLLPGLDALK